MIVISFTHLNKRFAAVGKIFSGPSFHFRDPWMLLIQNKQIVESEDGHFQIALQHQHKLVYYFGVLVSKSAFLKNSHSLVSYRLLSL